jgi:Flp pilus assembly protein TadB
MNTCGKYNKGEIAYNQEDGLYINSFHFFLRNPYHVVVIIIVVVVVVVIVVVAVVVVIAIISYLLYSVSSATVLYGSIICYAIEKDHREKHFRTMGDELKKEGGAEAGGGRKE